MDDELASAMLREVLLRDTSRMPPNSAIYEIENEHFEAELTQIIDKLYETKNDVYVCDLYTAIFPESRILKTVDYCINHRILFVLRDLYNICRQN